MRVDKRLIDDERRAVIQNLGVILRAHPQSLALLITDMMKTHGIGFDASMRCLVVFWFWSMCTGSISNLPTGSRTPLENLLLSDLSFGDIRAVVLRHFYFDADYFALHHRMRDEESEMETPDDD